MWLFCVILIKHAICQILSVICVETAVRWKRWAFFGYTMYIENVTFPLYHCYVHAVNIISDTCCVAARAAVLVA